MIRLLLCLFILICSAASAANFSILQSDELNASMEDVARLRMTVFRDYPYSYDGTLEYEQEYLEQYISTNRSVVIVAKDGDRVVGSITGIPLNETFGECKSLFVEQGIPMDSIYYLGEITLLKEYRGKEIGANMYKLFEQFVRDAGVYRQIALCEVIPQENDPRKPPDYFCLDEFWTTREFVKQPQLVAYYSWREVGGEEEFYHPMVFWLKDL